MAAPAPTAVPRQAPRAILVLSLFSCALFTSCLRQDVDHDRQVEGLKSDLESARHKLTHAQTSLATKEHKLILTETVLEETTSDLAGKTQALAERDAQLQAVRTELETLKKSDAFVFAEIATLHQQGQSATALKRYQKFLADFPKSPLAGSAASGIAKLSSSPSASPSVAAGPRAPAAPIDPRQRERELLKNFHEGYMTLQELAPILRKKSVAQVTGLLGAPNRTFNEGTEIGYADKAMNPVTGTKGMLVITFEADTVAALRVEYAGRKMTP